MTLKIEPERLAAELAADADVIRSLRENGDIPTIVRPVDVRFVGGRGQIEAFQTAIAGTDWQVLQVVALNEIDWACDVQREQTTDEATLRSLTEDALRLEAEWGVRYDGWGTVAMR
jgi:hypothetical protein